jgi:hypothetical protein
MAAKAKLDSRTPEAVKARLAAMTPEQREEGLLNLLRFMCSDDDGNWDEAAAEELRRACEKKAGKR